MISVPKIDGVAVKIFKIGIQALAVVLAFTLATSLISSDSDVGALAGAVLLIAVITFVLSRGWRLITKNCPPAGLAILIVATSVLGGCTKAPPGEVGIKVNYYGSSRGVSDFPLRTGMIWYDPFTETVLTYPTYVQTAIWTRNPNEGSATNEEITYNSSEGLQFTADISLSYHLVTEKVPAFYVKFRSDDLRSFTNGYLHNVARDEFNEVASGYTTAELYGNKKDTVLKEVRDRVNATMADVGVVIDQFGYIGAPRPPENVITAINAKIQAIQEAAAAQNRVAKAEADARSEVAKAQGDARATIARAEGQAKANATINASLTANLLTWEAVRRWDGRRPMVEGTGAGILLNVTGGSK